MNNMNCIVITDACYEAWKKCETNDFTTIFIEKKYHKSKTRNCLTTVQLITNSAHFMLKT